MKALIISESDIIITVIESILKESKEDIEVISTKKLEFICNMSYENIQLIVLDIRNEYLDYLDFVNSVKSINPQTKVIVLDIRKRVTVFKYAIKAGVEGYIADIPDKNEFSAIIYKIIDGKKYYNADLLSKLLENNEPIVRAKLTKRENEVLQLVGDGCNNKQIGDKLYITEYTVKKHITNIFMKLNLRNRKEAISYVKLQK